MKELCRVAAEVRVYPLVLLDGRESRRLPHVVKALRDEGIETVRQPVQYRFQRDATDMLVARKSDATR